LEIVLKKQPEERRRLLMALEGFAREEQLTAKALQAADLALEEHLTNVWKYGFADTAEHEIRVRLRREGGLLRIEVEDDGRAYNPLERPPVDTSVPLEEREVGGLGIHLMRQFMDELDYRREGGRNILSMTKRL
jgi:anti-sigma regulatory factor (Ser/Thr protein kinase)